MEKFVITVVFLVMVTNVLVSADWDDDVVYDDMDLKGKHASLSVPIIRLMLSCSNAEIFAIKL